MVNNLSSIPERFRTLIRLALWKKGTRWVKGGGHQGSQLLSFPIICQNVSLYALLLQLTTKVELQGGKWAEKNVLVSYSDGSLDCLADEGGGRRGERG